MRVRRSRGYHWKALGELCEGHASAFVGQEAKNFDGHACARSVERGREIVSASLDGSLVAPLIARCPRLSWLQRARAHGAAWHSSRSPLINLDARGLARHVVRLLTACPSAHSRDVSSSKDFAENALAVMPCADQYEYWAAAAPHFSVAQQQQREHVHRGG